jgi:16S rRNA (guanine966-N2)-methyltransferase
MRVIGGELGGRTLVAPRGMATRPTSDRAREALFSILRDVAGAAVLDLYAGTGALGIEALSRGAASAIFVESGAPALVALRKNLDALDLRARARILGQPVARALAEVAAAGPFDLVFIDPPYVLVRDVPAAVGRLCAAPNALGPDVRVVLEHGSRDPAPDLPGLERGPTRVYGDTSLTFFMRFPGPLGAP